MPEPAPPVIIGRDVLSLLPGYLKQLSLKEPLFIITDTNVLLLHLPKLLKILEAHSLKYHVCTIPAGEVSKNFNSAQVLINQILKYNPNRQSTIIAFGGGVVGDIAGFVASIIWHK
jgi:3-dehydroquinate synthetase